MHPITRIIVIAASLTFSALASAQDISEASVKEFLARFDKAIAAKNAAEIGKSISENADFSGKISAGGRVQAFRYSKAQYMALLRDIWAQASNYTYRRSNEEIVISGGKAVVTADISESMVLQGNYVSTKSKEVATLEKINGVLLVTKAVVTGSQR